ncbi:MAG: NlpC/P60 family protein [Bacteroidales bacterium]
MKFGISQLSIIPVRKDPFERSEMTTQLLFGEHFIATEGCLGWIKIKIAHDNYEGWIDEKMINYITKRKYNAIDNAAKAVSKEIFQIVLLEDGLQTLVVAGSSLPLWKSRKKVFSLGSNLKFSYEGTASYNVSIKRIPELLKETATMFLNSPYLWGGKTPFGTDCSGFVQTIYRICSISLPRDASQQVHTGETIGFVNETKFGDLVFFDNDQGSITHVGMVWENRKIIHASGKVRIDSLDQHGIFNEETKKYTHKLRTIKRIVEQNND